MNIAISSAPQTSAGRADSLAATTLIPNPGYKGRLSQGEIKTIAKRYPDYLELEHETKVPWQVIAALDTAVPDLFASPKKLATLIADGAREGGFNFPAVFDERDAAVMLAKVKEQTPASKHGYLDSAYGYFCEIGRAFV